MCLLPPLSQMQLQPQRPRISKRFGWEKWRCKIFCGPEKYFASTKLFWTAKYFTPSTFSAKKSFWNSWLICWKSEGAKYLVVQKKPFWLQNILLGRKHFVPSAFSAKSVWKSWPFCWRNESAKYFVIQKKHFGSKIFCLDHKILHPQLFQQKKIIIQKKKVQNILCSRIFVSAPKSCSGPQNILHHQLFQQTVFEILALFVEDMAVQIILWSRKLFWLQNIVLDHKIFCIVNFFSKKFLKSRPCC